MAGTQAFQELRFETNGYTLNPVAAGDGALATTGSFSIIDVVGSALTTISAPIVGTAGLTKTGAGTLTLTGANTYSGLTTVAEGTLVLGGSLAGAVQNNATLANSANIAGLVTNAGTLSNIFILGGGLVNSSGATANLASIVLGTVTNSGTVNVIGGGVRGIDAFVQNAGGTFNLAGINTSIGSLAGTGTVNLGSANLTIGSTNSSTSYSGIVTGTGGLVKDGTGTLTLTGANTYTGLTTVAGGTLAVRNSGALGTADGGTTVNSGATLQFQGRLLTVRDALTISGSGQGGLGALRVVYDSDPAFDTTNLFGRITLAANSTITVDDRVLLFIGGGIQLGGSTLTFNSEGIGSSTTRVESVISGTGGVIKTGNGLLELNAANTFTGPFTIAGGDVNLTGRAALADSVAVSVGTDARLFVSDPETIGSLAGNGSVIVATGSVLTTGANNTSTTFAGTIDGAGALTKVGTGTFTLAGAHRAGGPTEISGGTLQVLAGGSIASNITNNASLVNAGTIAAVLNNGVLSSSGVLTGLVNAATGSATLSGQLNGVIINQGNVTLAGATTGIGNVTQSAGTFSLNGFDTTFASLSGGGGTIALGSATLTISGTGLSSTTFDGTITGTGGLVKNGPSTFALSRAQGYTGLTTINAGALIIGAAGSLAGAVQNNAGFSTGGAIAGLVTNAGRLTSSGTLAGGLINAAGATALLQGTVNGTIANSGSIFLTGALRATGAFTQTASAVFDLGGRGVVLGSLAGEGQVRIGDAILTVGNATSTTFGGVISGAGALNKNGAGTLTLTGANRFTGLASVNDGGLVVATGASLGGGIANAASLTNAGTVSGLVQTFAGATTVNTGTFAGGATNAGTLTSSGTILGGFTNSGIATLSGRVEGLVENGGTISLAGLTTGIGRFAQTLGGTLDLGGFDTAFGSLSGGGAVRLGRAMLTTGGDNSTTAFEGAITGAGGLTKVGSGTLTLSGASGYDGLTTVGQGVLAVRSATALGSAAGGTVVLDGAALHLQGGVTIAGEALTLNGNGVAGTGVLRNIADNNIWSGTVTLASDSTIIADAGRLDIDLLAGGSLGLTTGGAGLVGLANATTTGTLTVTGGSTALFGSGSFAGGVNITGGALFLQGGTSVADSAAVNLTGGSLIVAVSETIGSLAATAGTVQIDSGQTLTLGDNDASSVFAGVIFNTGNLVKRGSGTFTVTGTLAHTGTTTISGGTLLSGAADIWQANGPVTIAEGGTLDLGGFEQSIAAISLAGGTLANGALAGAITSTGGIVRDITGANSLLATGGTTILTGAGSFLRGVTLAGGNVTLQGAGSKIDDSALVTVNAGTLAIDASEIIGALAGSGGTVRIAASQTLTTGGTGATTTYAGVIAGSGNLVKTGAGVMTLSGANTLSGLTTVSAGTLSLTGTASLAGGVQNNAGLTNAGTIGGVVTNAGTLVSSGRLDGGLVNSGSAALSGQLNGTVSNTGLIQLQGTLTGMTAFSQTASGRFDLANFATSIGSLSGSGAVTLGTANLTLGAGNASSSFGGTISGTGGLVKTGTGTFTLTSGQAYTGLTTVNGGTLAITATGGLSGSVLNNATFQSAGVLLGSLTNNGTALLQGVIEGGLANTATVNLTGSLLLRGRFDQTGGGTFNLAGFHSSIGSLAGAGSVLLGAASLEIGSDNTSSLFSGVIGGAGGITKRGTGVLTLTGVNAYTGVTVVEAGTLVIGTPAGGTAGASAVASVVAAPAPAAPDAASPGVSSVIAAAPVAVEDAALPGAAVLVRGATVMDSALPAEMRLPELVPGGDTAFAASAGLTPNGERLALVARDIGGPARVDFFAAPVIGLAEDTGGAATAIVARDGSFGPALVAIDGSGLARTEIVGAGDVAAVPDRADPVAAMPADRMAASGASGMSAADTAFSTVAPTTAVIAGSVLNNASVINNGTILGQLVNSTGAVAVNNGVIRGAVVNRGTLTSVGTMGGGLDNSGTARISGTVTGTVINAGSITLTGNTSGITFLEQTAGGVFNLAGFDTTIGSLSGAGSILLGAARLTTGADGVNTLFSGTISGTGSLTKAGGGALILTGANTYAGGTTISGGTLQLGNGGTSGSIVGPVVNNGIFAINRSDAYTFAGVISGSGAFVQAGTGTTTLTGANTYRGGTLISGGRLIGNTVSLQGLIQNDAALEFAQETNGVFAGRIFGSGLFDKSGAGRLDLTGDNGGLRGATTVRAGELRVTGSLAGSVTTVLSGATLSGTGTIGGLIARSGAVVAPGVDGLGVLGVNGAVQLQSGSTLRVQIQAAQGIDALVANGAMQLGGTVAFSNLGGTYAFNSRYVLLQTSGARSGTFDAVTGFADFGILYRPELLYTANQVVLQLAPNLLTNIVGNTPLTGNQSSVVSRIDEAVTGGYNPQPLFNVYSLPTAQLPNAFDQLSGEVYATAAGVGIEQERLVREAVLGRVAAVAGAARQTPAWGSGAGAWGQIFGSWGDGDSDRNAARFESDRQGFITGIDYGGASEDGSWRVGVYGLTMNSRVTIDARGSRAEIEQDGGGLYAGITSGGFSAAVGASLTEVDLTAVRNIALPGFTETNRGRGDGSAVQGFGEISYAVTQGKATYRPFVNLALGSFRLDALNETGGAAALAVRRQSYSSGSITAGADGAVQAGKVRFSGMLAGRIQTGDRDPAARIALTAAPGSAFAVEGVQLDSVALSARLDATLQLGKNAELSLGYTGLIGKNTADHGTRATLSVRF